MSTFWLDCRTINDNNIDCNWKLRRIHYQLIINGQWKKKKKKYCAMYHYHESFRIFPHFTSLPKKIFFFFTLGLAFVLYSMILLNGWWSSFFFVRWSSTLMSACNGYILYLKKTLDDSLMEKEGQVKQKRWMND